MLLLFAPSLRFLPLAKAALLPELFPLVAVVLHETSILGHRHRVTTNVVCVQVDPMYRALMVQSLCIEVPF